MYQIKLMNKIAACGTDQFDENKYVVGENVENPDAIMVRSAALHDMAFGKELLAIARAGAGVNNIPIDRCSENGIVVFNTPGANAGAVKELALCALLLASRKIVDGINWAQTLTGEEDVAKAVEKGKSQFVGPELAGKSLGIIGFHLDLHKVDGIIRLDGNSIETGAVRFWILDKVREIVAETSWIFLIERCGKRFGHILVAYHVSFLLIWCHTHINQIKFSGAILRHFSELRSNPRTIF